MTYTIVTAESDKQVLQNITDSINLTNVNVSFLNNFTDGKELLKYLQGHHVNLVICDSDIYGVDGYRISEYLSEFHSETGVIIIGSSKSYDAVKKAFDCGAKNYILKPINQLELATVINKLAKGSEIFDSVSLKSLVEYIENLLTDKFNPPEHTSDVTLGPHNVIEKANEYIRLNYYKDITRKDVAEAVFMNPSYFSRYYKKMTGMYYSDYLAKVRIENAIELMKSGNPLSDISTAVGYHTRRYFNTNFTNVMGISPKDYRLTLKSDIL